MSARAARGEVDAGALDRRTVWRWHFYAGLLCVPFVVLLSLTGAIYLFKPQLDAWQERLYSDTAFAAHAGARPGMADAQVAAALAHVPGSTLAYYELPPAADAAARVGLVRADGARVRVFVHPQAATVLGTLDEADYISQFVKTLHGELLLGTPGSLLVELAACWAIVMIVTGLWLWWPRGVTGLAPGFRKTGVGTRGGGVWWPRLGRGGRVFWRDLHAVAGVWVSVFALFLLLTGLPWATVWGAAFKEVRTFTGTAVARQDWASGRADERAQALATAGGSAHASQHGHARTGAPVRLDRAGVTMQRIVDQAAVLALAAPVRVSRTRDGDWQVQSESQNRPLRATLRFAAADGRLLQREDFADRHVIDRAVGIGVAAHEGHLFGLANQLLGLATALALVGLCVSSLVPWWARRPSGELGAPPPPASAARPRLWVSAAVLLLGITLPVLGASLLLVLAIDWLLPRVAPSTARWLGITAGHARVAQAGPTPT